MRYYEYPGNDECHGHRNQQTGAEVETFSTVFTLLPSGYIEVTDLDPKGENDTTVIVPPEMSEHNDNQ